MRISILVLLVSGLALSSCGGWRTSPANPGNWFNGSQPTAAVPISEEKNPLLPQRSKLTLRAKEPDTSVLITSIKTLNIERTPTGAIVHATGIAARQGAFNVVLKPKNIEEKPEDGVLTYEFRVLYPKDPTTIGTEHTRKIEAARSLSNQTLAKVRTIRVVAEQNARESRR